MPDGSYICSTKFLTELESIVGRDRCHIAVYLDPGAMKRGASVALSADDNHEFVTHRDGVWHLDGTVLGAVDEQIADASLGVGSQESASS